MLFRRLVFGVRSDDISLRTMFDGSSCFRSRFEKRVEERLANRLLTIRTFSASQPVCKTNVHGLYLDRSTWGHSTFSFHVKKPRESTRREISCSESVVHAVV